MYKTTGFISFFLRRFTGVALVLYLFTHMWVIGSANGGPEVFNARLNLVQTTFFATRPLEMVRTRRDRLAGRDCLPCL